jgi:hypothetical protein
LVGRCFVVVVVIVFMGGTNGKLVLKGLVEELHSQPRAWNATTSAPDGSSTSFWDAFWSPAICNLSLSDVFEILHFAHVTLVRQSQPVNLVTLVVKLVQEIHRVVALHGLCHMTCR